MASGTGKSCMTNDDWRGYDIGLLCELYQCEEVLYKVDSPNYHNRDLRTEAWKRIAGAMGENLTGT